jgi:hypothetical protein
MTRLAHGLPRRSAHQPTNEIVARQRMMSGNCMQYGEGSGTQRVMQRHSGMVLAVLYGCQPDVTPGLARPSIPEALQTPRQLRAGQVARSFTRQWPPRA